MENFTLQSPYIHLVVLFLGFLFKTSVLAKHSNPLKILVIKIQEGLSYFFIDDAG